MIEVMVRLGSRVQRSVRGVGSACAVLCLVSSCSLRDTSFLDSEPSAGGVGGDASAGMSATQAGSSGDLASAGNGVAGGGAGGMNPLPSGGEGGDLDAGSGGMAGMEELPDHGTFSNCPSRSKWMISSNPTIA